MLEHLCASTLDGLQYWTALANAAAIYCFWSDLKNDARNSEARRFARMREANVFVMPVGTALAIPTSTFSGVDERPCKIPHVHHR